MTRMLVVTMAAITFTAATIGANNLTRFQMGHSSLDNRAEYCDWISSDQASTDASRLYSPTIEGETLYPTLNYEAHDHLWSLGRRLAPYRSKRVVFNNVPDILLAEVKNQKLQKEKDLQHINKSIQLLMDQAKTKKHSKNPLTEKIDQQIESLQAQAAKIEVDIDHLSRNNFSDWDIFALMQAAHKIDEEGTNLPVLGLEIEVVDKLFKRQARVFPAWVDKKGQATRASQTPYFEISGSMVTDELIHNLKNKQLPQTYSAYFKILHLPANKAGKASEERSIASKQGFDHIQVLSNQRIIIRGSAFSNRTPESLFTHPANKHFTSASNVAVDAILDLGCVQNSHWSKELVQKTRNFINESATKGHYKFKEIHKGSLATLSLLEQLNDMKPKVTK